LRFEEASAEVGSCSWRAMSCGLVIVQTARVADANEKRISYKYLWKQ